MNLSVIIPAYDALEDVLHAVVSIRRTTDEARVEVLVQDDCSPRVNFTEYMPPHIAQRNPENLGFPGNCNAGAARARGDVLMFINQDARALRYGWDRILLDWFVELPFMGIAGPTLLFPDGRVQSVGGKFDGHCQPYHPLLGAQNAHYGEYALPRRVSWVTGAALAIRRDLWQALGGFDTVYGRGYFEDVDLCVRAQMAGAEVWHLPGVQLQHRVGSTGGNPRYMQNALEFKRRWVDTKKITPDTHHVRERFW